MSKGGDQKLVDLFWELCKKELAALDTKKVRKQPKAVTVVSEDDSAIELTVSDSGNDDREDSAADSWTEIPLDTDKRRELFQVDSTTQKSVLKKHFPHYYKIYKKRGRFAGPVATVFRQAELTAANVPAAEYIVRQFSLKNGKIRIADDSGSVREVWAGELLSLLRDQVAEGAESQSDFLNRVREALLTPYYQELDELDVIVDSDIDAEIERKLEQLRSAKTTFKARSLPEIEEQIRREVKRTFADIREKEVARINRNIKDVKLSINRGLSAYNKTKQGKRIPFLSRVVALANTPGTFWEYFERNMQVDDFFNHTVLQEKRFLAAIEKSREENPVSTEVRPASDGELTEGLMPNDDALVFGGREFTEKSFSKVVRFYECALEETSQDYFKVYQSLKKDKSIAKHELLRAVHDVMQGPWKLYEKDSLEFKVADAVRRRVLEKTDQAYYDFFVKAKNIEWEVFFELRRRELDGQYFKLSAKGRDIEFALIEAEWKRVTRHRRSFMARKRELMRQGLKKDEAMNKILLDMKQQDQDDCDKCYVVVDYTPDVLHRVKSKAAKHANLALRIAFSLSTGASEGVVAGVAMAALIALIPGAGIILPLAIGILVGIMGGLVNMSTLSFEGTQPIKEILRLRLFGEAGKMLRNGELGWGAFFITSTIGYSLASGIFSVSALLGLGFPPVLAIVAGLLCFIALYALYQNMVTRLVKSGGLEKLKRMFDFKKIWRDVQLNHPEMGRAEQVLYFVFVQVFVIKILGMLAKLLTTLAFGKAFFEDSDKFAVSLGVGAKEAAGVAWLGVVLSSPVALLFFQEKMESVWGKLKSIFAGTEGIFALGENGRRHVNKDRLGYFVGTALNSFVVGVLKVVFITAIFPLFLIAGIFGGIWSLHNKIRYKMDRVYRDRVDQNRLKNHKVHAAFNSVFQESLAAVGGTIGGLSAVGNAAGQGALTSVPAMSVVPSGLKTSSPIAGSGNTSSFGFIFNILCAATAFVLGGLSSFILNYEGLEDTLGSNLSDGQDRQSLVGRRRQKPNLAKSAAQSWKDLGRMVKLVGLSLFYLIAQHGCATRKGGKGCVSKESFVRAVGSRVKDSDLDLDANPATK